LPLHVQVSLKLLIKKEASDIAEMAAQEALKIRQTQNELNAILKREKDILIDMEMNYFDQMDVQAKYKLLEASALHGWTDLIYKFFHKGDEFNYPFDDYLLKSIKNKHDDFFDILVIKRPVKTYLKQVPDNILESILTEMVQRKTHDSLFVAVFKELMGYLRQPTLEFLREALEHAKAPELKTFLREVIEASETEIKKAQDGF
jgi:hypothetical protein